MATGFSGTQKLMERISRELSEKREKEKAEAGRRARLNSSDRRKEDLETSTHEENEIVNNLYERLEEVINKDMVKVNKKVGVELRDIFDGFKEIISDLRIGFSYLNGRIKERSLVEDLMRAMIQEQSEAPETSKNYANAVKSGSDKRKRQKHLVLVYPTDDKQTGLKSEIMNNVNPTNHGLGIRNIREVKNGGTLIEVSHESEIEGFKEVMGKKMKKDSVKFSRPKKRIPQVIIYDVDKDTTKEQLSRAIRKQNNAIPSGSMEVLFPIKQRDPEKMNWVARVNGKAFSYLTHERRLNIGWGSNNAKEFLQAKRCFKCNAYGHTQANCVLKPKCTKCGDETHMQKACKNSPKCSNCVTANERYGLKLEVNHSVMDSKCSCRERELDIMVQRTDYNAESIFVPPTAAHD